MRQFVQYKSSVMWHLMLPELNQVAQLSFQGRHLSRTWHFIAEESARNCMRQLVQYKCSVIWDFMLPEINSVAQLFFQVGQLCRTWHFTVEEIYKKLHETVGTVQVQCKIAFHTP